MTMTTVSTPASATDAETLQVIKVQEDKKPKLDRTKIATYLHEAIMNGFAHVPRNFESVKEMDEHFRAHRDWIYECLPKQVRVRRRTARVLEVLKMHSCKYLGISWKNVANLRAAYADLFSETISRDSMMKILTSLSDLGIINVIHTKKRDGRQATSIIVLQRFKRETQPSEHAEKFVLPEEEREVPKAPEVSEVAEESAPSNPVETASEEKPYTGKSQNPDTLKANPSFKANPFKDLRERRTSTLSKPSKLLNLVPKFFQEQIRCITTQGKAVLEYWRVGNYVVNKVFNGKVSKDEMQDILQTSVRAFFKKMKAASRGVFEIRNPYGYLNAIVESEATAFLRRRAHESIPNLYDWLAE